MSDERIAQRPGGDAADPQLHAAHTALDDGLAVRQADPEHGERDDKPGDRPGRADVEELAPIGEDRAQPDERAERADQDGNRRRRQEKRR